MRGFILALALVFSTGALAAKQVEKAEYGKQWPLTVDEAVVDCVRGAGAVVSVDGKTYQLNGTASAMGYPDVRPIWKDNPDNPGSKISISPLITAAKTQC